MANSDPLREKAARLFVMAIEAQDKGNSPLANLLTEAATRYLDRSEDSEARYPPPVPVNKQ